MRAHTVERRDLTTRGLISAQLRSILSSPSILLTVQEAERLLGLTRDVCERILRRLETNGVMQQVQRGVYTPTSLISGIPRM
jgi:predicted transcriptional regulator of viral defense system